MGPVDLYTIVGAAAVDSVATLAGGGELEAYRSLEPLVRVGIQFAGTVLVAIIVLGLCQRSGTQAVAKSRRSPIISSCIGLPSLLVVVGLASTGYLIVDSSIGTFFGIPLVILGVVVLPVATALGLVAIGRTVASRLGDDRLGVGVLAGALLCGIAGVSLPATVVLAGLAGVLGIGASIRVVFGATGAARPDDRTVPPANKI
ncbi:hypothetical protein [Natrinema versiforme]|uniref:Uncharacterized protein n=1 Tax=Natrinema versiforme JCM 10478 TaxID=1227496 RepID=L9Y5A8_9EURY|nr:hypothetical protein [Natrinema versiforme]ELY69250.1 hypothetical protein C489_04823 [Natrinema versiforme JCM 10478]